MGFVVINRLSVKRLLKMFREADAVGVEKAKSLTDVGNRVSAKYINFLVASGEIQKTADNKYFLIS